MVNKHRNHTTAFIKSWFAQLFISNQLEPNNHHLVFSDPRGGSTWLMEIIQSITKEPVVWEPLHLGRQNNPFSSLDFGWRQYIPEDAEWNEAKDLFDQLFHARILRDRIKFQQTDIFKSPKAKSLLYKICRGNALLPWLVQNYDFVYKPIYLIRHPFAIVCSQIRHGAWGEYLSVPEIEKPRHFDQMYQRHSNFLSTLKTKEEILTAQWCLGNSPSLQSINNNIEWITIAYEDLVQHPKPTIGRVLDSWSLNYDVNKINFDRNSSTTQADSPDSAIKRISYWKDYFTSDQIEKMGVVLEVFGIEVYSKDCVFPHSVSP